MPLAKEQAEDQEGILPPACASMLDHLDLDRQSLEDDAGRPGAAETARTKHDPSPDSQSDSQGEEDSESAAEAHDPFRDGSGHAGVDDRRLGKRREPGRRGRIQELDVGSDGEDEPGRARRGAPGPISAWRRFGTRTSPSTAPYTDRVRRGHRSALDLCDPEELSRLRQTCWISSFSICRGSSAKPRQPPAAAAAWPSRTRSWDFNLDEGLLDTARLARVVVNPHALR